MKASAISMEHLVTDLKAVARDGEDLIHASKTDISEAASVMRERLAKSVESAKATCRQLQEKTIVTAKKADTAVREHPYHVAGIAFGVGLLVGVLVARRS